MTQPDPYAPPPGQSPFGGSGPQTPPSGPFPVPTAGPYGPPSGPFPVPTAGPYGPPPGQPPYGPPGQPPYVQPVVSVAAKSAGLAAVLSFFWLGVGHLYANRIGVGIALMIYDAFLGLLAFTLVGIVVAFPLWLISTPIVMYLSAQAANEFNRRNGLIVR